MLIYIILFSGDLIQNGRIMTLSTSLPEFQMLLLEKAFSDPVLFFNWVKCDNKQFNSFSCKDLKLIGSSFPSEVSNSHCFYHYEKKCGLHKKKILFSKSKILWLTLIYESLKYYFFYLLFSNRKTRFWFFC